MNTIILSPSTNTPSPLHRQFPQTITFRPTLLPPNQISSSFSGDVKFAKLKYKAFSKPNTIEVQQQIDSPCVNKQHAIQKYAEEIRLIFSSMDDGKITPSAYDAAWLSLIEDVNEPSSGPQFPSCLQWVVNNQLYDGSWGEPMLFSAYDRLTNTLACVITLTYWNIHPEKCQKGIRFVNENMNKLENENLVDMPIGFEIVFPSLIEFAQKLEIKVPDDSPILKQIYAERDLKLSKIPKDIFHKIPTSLLYSLEGMKDIEWEKVLKLKCVNGSMFFSPSATAFAFRQTKDRTCLAYLTNVVAKFNGGVPHTYPVDMFEHIWIIDRLQRLGIARYFRHEIKDCVDYIYRYWDVQGIGFGRYTNVPDVDDTAMGFRVLRTHGYQISPDVFQRFEKDGHFSSYQGQSSESVTGMFNLYRASQILFPGEKILGDAKKFSYQFLTEKRSTNELLDKWLITKDLPGEVGYSLDVPWYASLPRLEARYYLEQYGGEDDIWIGKTLYRMGNVNNNKYLEMAKLDYNHCQKVHQLEWSDVQKWYTRLKIEESLKIRPLQSYYEAAASIFEPERCNERVAWAKTTILLDVITSFFARPQFSNADMQEFVNEFTDTHHHDKNGKPWHLVMVALHQTIEGISMEALKNHGIDIHPDLYSAWLMWMSSWQKGVGVAEEQAELIVQTLNMSSGRWLPKERLSHPQYQRLSSLTNKLCHQISYKDNSTIGLGIEAKMQLLVQLVLCDIPDDLDPDLKQTFLTVAKTFYYRAYFDSETINHHIRKVLFETVI